MTRTNSTRTSRRTFLQAMGLAAGTLFLPSLGRVAHADTALPPQRLVFFFTQHGTVYDGWSMHQGRDPGGRWSYDLAGLTEAEFSDGLRPLHRHRRKLTILDGLALVSAEADQSGLRHELAQVHALTGANATLVGGTPLASAPSIDQRIADVLARADRHRTIEMAIGGPPIGVNYRGDRMLLPMEYNPAQTFDRLFGMAGGGTDPIVQERSSVLDRVSNRYDALSSRLSGEDRVRLEVHRDLVRDLEVRVRGLASATCGTRPDGIGPASGDYLTDFQNFARCITAAFSCDLTRIATFHMGQLDGDRVDPSFRGDIHDEAAHGIYESAEAARVMTQYTRTHADEFAWLLDQLDAIPEGDGTMLDHTTVIWCGEIADGAHGFEHWPVVMAGGRNLDRGRYHHWPSDTPFAGWAWDGRLERMGVPHQRFLTTVARSFGIDIDRMPVTEIIGTGGARIDCTGVLEGVLA